MKNKKIKTQMILMRVLEIFICICLFGFLFLSFKFFSTLGIIKGALWTLLVIPIPFLLVLCEYVINNLIITEVDLFGDRFHLLYRNKKKIIAIKYSDIIQREKSSEDGRQCIKYITNNKFKTYVSGKKGEIVSLLFDDEIFDEIDKGYKKWIKIKRSD